MNTTKSKYINGPLNVIRLEGKINNINKVLYIFMDLHIEVTNQTKCEEYLSEDIMKYVKSELIKFSQDNKDKDKYIDFFMEHRLDVTENMIMDYVYYKDKYIDEMQKFFLQNFKNNSKEFNNVRFHYADIRSSKILFDYKNIDDILKNYNCSNYRQNNVTTMVNIYNMNLKYLFEVQNYLLGKKKTNNKEKYTPDTPYNKIENLVSKYTNKDVKIKISALIEKYITESNKLSKIIKINYDLILKHEEICNKYFNEKGYRKKNKDELGISSYYYDDNDIISDIIKNHDKIYAQHMLVHALLMDIYFLRRFCDKNYVTNGLFYGGTAHCAVYINFLIKFFDFKITHASYLSKNLEEINKKLGEKLYSVDELNDFFYHEILLQCSDISMFPEKFE
jgi:hypothetical protein